MRTTHQLNINKITVSSGSLVESVERAAAPHEGSCIERGGAERGKAPAAAEADSRSGWTRCLFGNLMASAALVAEAVSFQGATSLTATSSRVTTSAVEAVAPSITNTGFRCTAANLFTSTTYRYC